MRKLLLLLLVLFGCTVPASAQLSRQQAREAEWKSYSLPKTNFARQISPDKDFIFRVPVDWQQQNSELIFNGPYVSRLGVVVQKIPDGYPLQDYFGTIVREAKDSFRVETPVTRKTQLQDLEAREILLETTNEEGEMYRSTSWITVNGPLAVIFNFQVPASHAAELEPYFKSVVQSVIFVSPDYPEFEKLRTATIKSPAPGPIHEIERIVADLNAVNGDRESAIVRLTTLFSSHADVAVDLLVDRRPFVRAAAVQALARSNNRSLTPFLWEVLDDNELIVTEAAARAVATAPDVVPNILKHSLFGLRVEIFARVWPFMPKDKRIELLQRIFSETAVRRSEPPPPVAAANGKAPKVPDVTVSVRAMEPVKPGKPIHALNVGVVSNDPRVQMGALTLLSTMPHEEFKLPLARIMASNYDPLIALGLQIAHTRGESLALDSLFKLVGSSDQQVSKLATQNLGLSATASDIPRIEAWISKDSTSTSKALDDELKLTVKKIRFRHELSGAKSAAEIREIIRRADSSLADFALRYDCELSVAGCSPATTLKPDLTVKPFAENLFPKKVRHYAAIPNPGQAVQKFYETLNGMQLDSPRAQSNLILTMGVMRQNLGQALSAPLDATTLIEYTGIDPNSPIVLGSWTAEGAPNSTTLGQRKAIVLRVKDRARFERTIDRYQRSLGAFTDLVDYVGIGTRAIAALPAVLPLTAQAIMSRDPKKRSTRYELSYVVTGEKEWNGLRIKTIEHYWVASEGLVEVASANIAFVGDTAILAPDLATIRDLLNNANGQADRQHLAGNPEFQKTIERRGEILYFSDLRAVMASEAKQAEYKLNESGALNITNASWENSHYLAFDEGDWSKPLLPFHPKELSAPRDLLPAKTIAYWLMKIDLPTFWSTKFSTDLLGQNLETMSKLLSLDFKQEVLAELGPECGAAILELPHIAHSQDEPTWAAFCKLKSNKLAGALSAGKLFSGVGPAQDFAEFKTGDKSYFVAVRNGFLVVSNRDKGLAAFDGKSNLATTRDYSRAVDKVPSGVVTFGGYNLEAAIAAAGDASAQGVEAQIADIIFSIASAFHSQNFFATATAGTIEGRSSVAMDRAGRYAVADFSVLPRASNITLAILDPTGVPITDQNRMSSLVVKLRAQAAGPIDNIKDDIKSSDQTIEQKSEKELLLTIAARRASVEKAVELPVKDPALADYLKATREFAVDDKGVKDKAREIAGEDRDAWSVARKLADWTHKNLEWKHVTNADAAQTLATREADCTEFSQLFVAMARSLGLPSRMVTGLAYSGSSFGAHAWVEVWAGKWIELDPTWGTHFVDATHIRNETNGLVMSAALNLIELEVVETRRAVADFQKSPGALVQHLIKAIPAGARSDLEAAIDPETLSDEFMGTGSWSKLSDGEREQMWSAYRRLMTEIIESYSNHEVSLDDMRLLRLEEKGNAAEAMCYLVFNRLVKLRLVRRNDLWSLVEILDADYDLYTASETLMPTINRIQASRTGQKAAAGVTDLARARLLLKTAPQKAVEVADAALKLKPADQSLRFVKALALSSLESQGPEKRAEAIKLLRELSSEAFAPAVYDLAARLSQSEDENEKREAITFYERYTSLEPHDPRGFSELASAYKDANELAKAEAAYRKAIERDSANTYPYLDLIQFLIVADRIEEARSLLVEAEKYKDKDEDLLGSVLQNLRWNEESKNAEKFAAVHPAKMKTSHEANLALGQILFESGRYPDALRLLETSAQLDNTSSYPHIWMALVYRKQSRWTAAVKAAQKAIELDDEDGEAYYQLACALTRLRRTKEALAALAKSVELDPDQAEYMVEEPDLKPLSSLRQFKKLIPAESKQ